MYANAHPQLLHPLLTLLEASLIAAPLSIMQESGQVSSEPLPLTAIHRTRTPLFSHFGTGNLWKVCGWRSASLAPQSAQESGSENHLLQPLEKKDRNAPVMAFLSFFFRGCYRKSKSSVCAVAAAGLPAFVPSSTKSLNNSPIPPDICRFFSTFFQFPLPYG